MKNLAKFLTIVLGLMLIFSLSVFADPKPTVDIKRGSAVIDGVIDDIWQYAEEMKIDRVDSGEMTDAAVYAKMLWDDENLYILMVADDNTKTNTDGPLYVEDCFEIFFDLNNEKTDTYSELNQFRFLYDILTPLETGMRNLENISEDALQYIEIAGSDVPTGYIMEVRINAGIGIDFSLKENMLIGIDFGYDDNTEGGEERTAQLTWNSDGTNAVASSPLAMGTIRLVAEEAMPVIEEVEEVEEIEETQAAEEPEVAATAPPAPQPNTDVPQTGDMAIAMLMVLALSGCAIAFAKSKIRVN